MDLRRENYQRRLDRDSLLQSKNEPGGGAWAVVEESSFQVLILNQSNSRSRGGGNVESAPLGFALSKEEKNPRFWGWGIFSSVISTALPRPRATARRVGVSPAACASRLRCRCGFPRCVVRRRGVSPGRSYCAGLGTGSRVSSGVW